MSDPFELIMEPLATLRRRAAEVLASRGLHLENFALAPGATVEGPHEAHLLVFLADGNVAVENEEFDRVVRGARDAETDRRAAHAKHEIEEKLRKNRGFL